MSAETDKVHAIIRDAFDKAGIVDGFYSGIMLDGTDVSAFQVGIPNRECYDNIARYHRLLGAVEANKHLLMNSAHAASKEL